MPYNNINMTAISTKARKSLLFIALTACFASAHAGSVFLDGQSVDDRKFGDGTNVVAGLYYAGEADKIAEKNFAGTGTPRTAFDASIAIDSTFNKVTITGGDLILGNYLTASVNTPKAFDASLDKVNVVVANSSIDENLVLGSKVNGYGVAEITSNIREANLTVENSTVGRAVVVGQLLKSSAAASTASLGRATMSITDSTIGGLLVGPALYHMAGDSSVNAKQSLSLGDVEVTLKGSTVNALANNTVGFDVDYKGAAIYVGGAVGSFAKYETSNAVSVGNVTLTLIDTKVQGDVYLGGSSHDADSTSTVESARLVLGEGTTISGAVHSGGASASDGAGASVDSATIVLDSTDVTIEKGVSKDATSSAGKVQYEGTGNFNDENGSAQESLAQLRRILGLGDEDENITIAEGESNGAISGDGTTTLNSKTERIGRTTAMNVLAWRLEMNDLVKRMGELRDNAGETGLWVRADAGRMKMKGEKNDFTQFQFGADREIGALKGTRLGAAFSYTGSGLDYADGTGDNKIYGLAAYGTWLGTNGSFVDLIAKIARLESDSTVAQTHADFSTSAWSVSAEVGHRFDFAPAFIEPQLELSYGHVSGKTFDTVNRVTMLAAETTVEAVDSLVGRAGLRAGVACPEKKGGAYLHLSVLHEFKGDVVVRRGDGVYTEDLGDTWVEYGVGAHYNFTPNMQVHADVERTSGALLSEPWRVNVGARWSF